MESEDIAKNMGFGSFHSNKKARSFDFMKLFEESRELAKLRNRENNEGAQQYMTNKEKEEAKKLSEETDSKGVDADDDDEDGIVDKMERKNDTCFVPCGDSLTLSHGKKPCSAVAIDPSGSRIATGGLDFDIKLWDFSGMDKSTTAFKSLQPADEQQVTNLEFSPSGDNLLIITASAVAKIVTRDGEEVCETTRGYPYITNPASAKGHTHSITGGTWHPLGGTTFLTSSLDSTMRVWDIENCETMFSETKISSHMDCIKLRDPRGKRAIPHCCAFSKCGNIVCTACDDGSVQTWDLRRPLVNPALICRNGLARGVETSSIAYSWDSHCLATRSTDDTLRLWDLRLLSKGSVSMVPNLPVYHAQTEVNFSPNDQLLITAVSCTKKDPNSGRIAIYKRSNMELVKEMHRDHGSVIRANWHPKINQIFCGCSDGSSTIYFDTEGASVNGALMCATRQATEADRRRRQGTGSNEAFIRPILIAYDEDSIDESRKMGRKYRYHQSECEVAVLTAQAENIKQRQDAQEASWKEAKTKMPPNEDDKSNRVGSLHKYMVQQIVLKNREADEIAEKDIRSAILRHDKDAQSNPYWTKAYTSTQPKPVFQKPELSDDEDDIPMKKVKDL